jgi:hypothetical protein
MKELDFVVDHYHDVLLFLKSRFPMYHLSNFFFRDVQFGIQTMLEEKKMKVGYAAAERIAAAFVRRLEKERIFLPIDRQAWVVNYPDFKKPSAKPVAPAKPSGSAPTVHRPAGQATPGGANAPLTDAPSTSVQAGTQKERSGSGK